MLAIIFQFWETVPWNDFICGPLPFPIWRFYSLLNCREKAQSSLRCLEESHLHTQRDDTAQIVGLCSWIQISFLSRVQGECDVGVMSHSAFSQMSLCQWVVTDAAEQKVYKKTSPQYQTGCLHADWWTCCLHWIWSETCILFCSVSLFISLTSKQNVGTHATKPTFWQFVQTLKKVKRLIFCMFN